MKAQIFNYRIWVKNHDPQYLKTQLFELLKLSNFEVLDFVEHRFKPYGYTVLWLLGESHLAIHTFPESSRSYIELASCNEWKYQRFLELMPNFLEIDTKNISNVSNE